MNSTKFPVYKISPGKKRILKLVFFVSILFVLLVGIVESSRLLFAWVVIENSTRFGIRYAVTGSYDPQYCMDTNDKDPDANGVLQNDDGNAKTGACVGGNANAEIDAARIPSIKDETRRTITGFFYDEAIVEAAPHYLNITVCSNRDGRWFEKPVRNSATYSKCHDTEDPADAGERVFVAVDYNFNFIVLPLFKIGPSMIHLASYREGFVEEFRGSRAVNTPLPSTLEGYATPSGSTPAITPNSTQTLQIISDEIDNQFKDLPKANIAFNKPEQMGVDEKVSIELILNPSLSRSLLATQVVERGNFVTSTAESDVLVAPNGAIVRVETSQIEITPRMKAVLKSQDPEAFTILEMHDNAEQVVSSVETTTWRWSVTAKKEGEQALELVIYQLVKYDGKDYWHEVETFKADILVEVTAAVWLKSLDWKWVAGFMLVFSTLVFLGLRNRSNAQKAEGAKPAKDSHDGNVYNISIGGNVDGNLIVGDENKIEDRKKEK